MKRGTLIDLASSTKFEPGDKVELQSFSVASGELEETETVEIKAVDGDRKLARWIAGLYRRLSLWASRKAKEWQPSGTITVAPALDEQDRVEFGVLEK